MTNANAVMVIEGISDPTQRENMQRINRLFRQGSFDFRGGLLTSELVGFTAASTTLPFVLQIARVGYQITLASSLLATTASKSGTADPVFATFLPVEYRPAAEVYCPWPITDNAVRAMGLLRVELTGRISWQKASATAAWTNAAAAKIHPSAATFLGAPV